jgi:hypothetical protein
MENQMGAFAVLPQELILCVLTALSASVDKPADLFNRSTPCLCTCTHRVSFFFFGFSLLLLE